MLGMGASVVLSLLWDAAWKASVATCVRAGDWSGDYGVGASDREEGPGPRGWRPGPRPRVNRE